MISEHDHSGIVFNCDLCEFLTSRKTSLSIHMVKKHKEIEQIDGSNSDSEDTYAESYWERDFMGRTYKTYLDTLENIKTSNLSLEEKQQESERAKRARMEAYLEDGWTVRAAYHPGVLNCRRPSKKLKALLNCRRPSMKLRPELN